MFNLVRIAHHIGKHGDKSGRIVLVGVRG